MQFLKSHDMRKANISLPVLAAICLLLPGCIKGFNHSKHLTAGVECSACHSITEGYEPPAMPAVENCTTCHEEKEGLKGYKLAKREQDKEWYQNTGFSHKNHAEDRGIACLKCHEGLKEAKGASSYLTIRSEICLECHKENKKEIFPKDHRVRWDKTHGKQIKEGFQANGEQRCYLCHTKDTCVTCHQDEAPQDHTNQWRQRGHGIASEIDRDRCARCHQMDECVRCHQQTTPRNHTAGWSGSSQRHCSVCHWPLNAVGCYTCHKGTPGHDTAPDRPGGTAHTSGSDCRACHTPGSGLPHPDDGGSCERCHR